MIRGIFLAAIIAAALSLPSAAYAGCAQSDLTGVWKAYSSGWNGKSAYWTRCTVTMNGAGIIAPSSTCINQAHQSGHIVSGAVIVTTRSTCTLTASFVLGGGVNKIVEGTLAKDKLTATGVGTFPGGTFILTMTKL